MSSPIVIPVSSVRAAVLSGSDSPTGLYVPVHKRNASGATSSSPSSSTSGSPGSARVKRAARASPAPTVASTTVRPATPISTHPYVYDAAALLTLASSPLAALTTAQLAPVQDLLTFTIRAPTTSAPGSSNTTTANVGEKATRRRRAGRRPSNAKKLAPEMHTDVESRRKRHGAWGWAVPHAEVGHGLEESWRHAAQSTAVQVA